MICFPNAKINLGLRITGKRPDGFHALSSIFLPVDVRDILEILPSEKETTIHCTGIKIDGDPTNNLCIRAHTLLQSLYDIPNVDIFLHKQIPPGSGLGGGSSNAASCLLMLDTLFGLNLEKPALFDLAMQLGSDCGFFIHNRPAIVSGRGEKIKEIEWAYPEIQVIILKPSLSISTAEAFKHMHPMHNTSYIGLPEPARWQDSFANDLEAYAIEQWPLIGVLIKTLQQSGALFAGMTGSGSAVYGLFMDPIPHIPPLADVTQFRTSIV